MTVMTGVFVLSGVFLAVVGFGIWNDIKRMAELERIKAEREERNGIRTMV